MRVDEHVGVEAKCPVRQFRVPFPGGASPPDGAAPRSQTPQLAPSRLASRAPRPGMAKRNRWTGHLLHGSSGPKTSS